MYLSSQTSNCNKCSHAFPFSRMPVCVCIVHHCCCRPFRKHHTEMLQRSCICYCYCAISKICKKHFKTKGRNRNWFLVSFLLNVSKLLSSHPIKGRYSLSIPSPPLYMRTYLDKFVLNTNMSSDFWYNKTSMSFENLLLDVTFWARGHTRAIWKVRSLWLIFLTADCKICREKNTFRNNNAQLYCS